METRIDGREGWIEVTHAGVHVLAKGDDALRQRLQTAMSEAAATESLADVITDELTTGGVRRTPDFAVLDETEGRVLVRGTASALLTGADDATREVRAPARGPWADEDVDAGVRSAVLATGEPESGTAAEAAAGSPAPATGWALPSVFGAGTASAQEEDRPALTVVPEEPEMTAAEVEPDLDPAAVAPDASVPTTPDASEAMPVDEGRVVESPAPQGQDIDADEPVPEPEHGTDAPPQDGPSEEDLGAGADPAAGIAAEGDDGENGDEELPSFDFLFGNTSHHRSSLLTGLEAEEGEASIDSGPVAAAGGYQAPEDPTNATLAPPEEDEGPGARPVPEESGPPISAMPSGLPPMPGSTSAEDEPAATPAPDLADPVAPAGPGHTAVEDGPALGESAGEAPLPSAPDRVPAAHDDQAGHEPGLGFPQFADGHLVGRRVPEPAAASHLPDQDGMISAVPWGDSAGTSDPSAGTPGGAPGLPFGLPGLPTPDQGPGQPLHAGPDTGSAQPVPADDTGELPSGPMVLAVRCSSGHHNAPHATRCRVCGQELPSQQPEQTPRPALGLLRLSTGDVVTLDRGVLIGRAPRASAEASGARAPHLVRIASPDNEISRNHVEIVLDGWHVLIRDLGSTNGTTVALPGSSPVRVRPGDQQTIEPGTTITLADQVSMVFEVTG